MTWMAARAPTGSCRWCLLRQTCLHPLLVCHDVHVRQAPIPGSILESVSEHVHQHACIDQHLDHRSVLVKELDVLDFAEHMHLRPHSSIRPEGEERLSAS